MKRAALLAALAPALLAGCNDHAGLLRAKVVQSRGELVGGPVAMAAVGDYLLENDQVRVAILGPRDSPGPGVYGGSIVDVDLKRAQLGSEDAQGHDRFAELFPVANLLVPDPGASGVSVLEDGSDGVEAAIRVEGKGEFLFEALGILRSQKNLLNVIFPDVHTELRFRTDYILRPGDRHVTIRTTLLDNDPHPASCPAPPSCQATCEFGFKDDAKGCATCDCETPAKLPAYTQPVSVFGSILGDAAADAQKKIHAGVIAGDFVFFGNQNDVFAPGPGFDEEKATQDAFNTGRNTFTNPLVFDWVAASGGDISYGYLNAAAETGASVVNVPLITSAATAFLSAGKNCLWDKSDDATCDHARAFTFERYLVVGDGDIASVAEEMNRIRGTAVGVLQGVVSSLDTGNPIPKAQVFVFRDPDPGRAFTGVDDLAEANLEASGDVGLLTAIDCDRGLDPVLDGDFHTTLPEGNYAIVAQSPSGAALSAVDHVHVVAGGVSVVDPMLPRPGQIDYRVSDDTGAEIPAKLTLVAIDDRGAPLEGDGKRRVYLGGPRYANGVRSIEYSMTGRGSFEVEPGRYRLYVSRGPELSVSVVQDFTVGAADVKLVDATLTHEIDSQGYLSADMHLHSAPSFDSGMPSERRLATVVAEDVELAIPTDHDVETDYGPTIRAHQLESFVASAPSSETTTLEQGHFIAFPERYDARVEPTHGSHDWTCEAGGDIMTGLRSLREDGHDQLLIVAHPRDGFFGYIDQLGVDPKDLNRTTGRLEEANPLFRTAGCDFDAMELINGKRLDLMRTATVGELVDYNHCRARVDASKTAADLDKACPELGPGPLAPCNANERLAVCRDRNRTRLAWTMMKRVLTRTKAEQDENWDFASSVADGEALCDLGKVKGAVPKANYDKPCSFHIGQVDDYFRYLEHGFVKGQVASSDSHDAHIEPGSPRTYFAAGDTTPAGLRMDDAVAALRNGNAFTTYGPFIRASVGGKSFGEVAPAPAGGTVDLKLRVETASWFGVDRVEIYENGRLIQELAPHAGREAIVDVDQTITIPVPKRDSWIVIVAMGLEDENLLRPETLDIQYGEIQLSRVAATAFGDIQALKAFFALTPAVPDFSPIPPYAVTNAIFLDTDGNGHYDAPLPFPAFCSATCDPKAMSCPTMQACLADEGVCGVPIDGACDHRRKPFGLEP